MDLANILSETLLLWCCTSHLSWSDLDVEVVPLV